MLSVRLCFILFLTLVASSSAKVIEMTEDDWTNTLKGEWMIEL
jgi:hypothetical protein